jgi:hypothetical protein
MLVSTSWLRVGAAALLTVGLLGLGLGCKGKSKTDPATSRIITGSVTYIRTPLHVGADGVPTGLETDLALNAKLPARGVTVRVFQARPQVDASGNTSTAWLIAGSATTDQNGNYTVNSLSDGYPTFVELYSLAASSTNTLRLIGEPAGIDSPVAQPGRALYVMRKGLDGTSSTVSLNPTPGTVLAGDATVNFDVGLSDNWLLAPFNWNVPPTASFPPVAPSAIVPAGSRVLAILDSVFTFGAAYGDATPGNLDLHYYPGVRHPRGSFVEYDTTLYPHAYDGSILHYFGTIGGKAVVNGSSYQDEAFDEGVLFRIYARNYLFGQHMSFLRPPSERVSSLTPTLAVVEGFADAMATNLLHSPYLPNTASATPYNPPYDVRDLTALTPAQINPFSPKTIAALAWEMTLKANLITSPGVPADWKAKIAPENLRRLFKLITPTPVSPLNTTVTYISDVASLYTQLGRMQEGQVATDPINLSAYFSDVTLVPILDLFKLPWPGILALPNYTAAWGADPDSLVKPLPSMTLSMAEAALVRGVYPNISKGEVAYATFYLTKDRAWDLSLATTPALPADAQVEVTVDAGVNGVYLFGSTHPASYPLALRGNYADLTLPVWHYLQIRIVSPAVIQPDLAVTLQLKKTN